MALRNVKFKAVPIVYVFSAENTTCPPLLHSLIACRMNAESSLPLPFELTVQTLVLGGEDGNAVLGPFGEKTIAGLKLGVLAYPPARSKVPASFGTDGTAITLDKSKHQGHRVCFSKTILTIFTPNGSER